jgi:hypothetical protein
MKCLRVYSTADGESHFGEVEIPTTSRQVHPNAAAFEVSATATGSTLLSGWRGLPIRAAS